MMRNTPKAVLLLLAVACGMESSGGRSHIETSSRARSPIDRSRGRLRARPHAPVLPPDSPGRHALTFGPGCEALLFVPANYRADVPAPLALLLHGAGGDARRGIDLLLAAAEEAGLLLLAPKSRRATWDAIRGSFGVDVDVIDRVLAYVFDRFTVDPGRLAIGGFSDGASYALSVGITNGDLFTHVIAFSPGFAAPGDTVGEPAIYITHGVDDRVLPIDRTSRPLRSRLEREGYRVVYEEFPDGHVVPPDLARRAVDWLTR